MDVVTAAFGYTGRHIARRLLNIGRTVKTLTSHPSRFDPFDGRVPAEPLDFVQPGRQRDSLRGATTLYNTYWVRFPRGPVTFDAAVANSRTLLKAAVTLASGSSCTFPSPGSTPRRPCRISGERAWWRKP